MSQLVDNLNAAISNLGGVIGQAVATLEAQTEIERSIAKLNHLADALKAVLPVTPALPVATAATTADAVAATTADTTATTTADVVVATTVDTAATTTADAAATIPEPSPG
jgi:hypothetical protein